MGDHSQQWQSRTNERLDTRDKNNRKMVWLQNSNPVLLSLSKKEGKDTLAKYPKILFMDVTLA